MNKLLIADIKSFNKRYHGSVHGSNADYITVYRDFCRNDGDFTASHSTKLYNQFSGEYCSLLSVLESAYSDHRNPAKYRIVQSGVITNERDLYRSYQAERDDYIPKQNFVRWIGTMLDNGLLERVYAK